LAISLEADFLLIDERKGRRIAAEHGLAVSGTLIVFVFAAQQGLIDLPVTIEKLKQTSFYISDRVVEEVLARDRARLQNESSPSKQDQSQEPE